MAEFLGYALELEPEEFAKFLDALEEKMSRELTEYEKSVIHRALEIAKVEGLI